MCDDCYTKIATPVRYGRALVLDPLVGAIEYLHVNARMKFPCIERNLVTDMIDSGYREDFFNLAIKMVDGYVLYARSIDFNIEDTNDQSNNS